MLTRAARPFTVGAVPPKRLKGHHLRGTAIRPAAPKNARRAATERDFGDPIKLVVLYRAPPPVRTVAGKMWIDAPTRKVTVIGGLGADRPRMLNALAVRRTNGWVGYADTRDYSGAEKWNWLLTTGPLDPAERDITWAWGWKSQSAKALKVSEALR